MIEPNARGRVVKVFLEDSSEWTANQDRIKQGWRSTSRAFDFTRRLSLSDAIQYLKISYGISWSSNRKHFSFVFSPPPPPLNITILIQSNCVANNARRHWSTKIFQWSASPISLVKVRRRHRHQVNSRWSSHPQFFYSLSLRCRLGFRSHSNSSSEVDDQDTIDQRTNAIRKIYTTELKYIEHLRSLVEVCRRRETLMLDTDGCS